MKKFFATFPKSKEYVEFEADCLSDAYQYMFRTYGSDWGALFSEIEWCGKNGENYGKVINFNIKN